MFKIRVMGSERCETQTFNLSFNQRTEYSHGVFRTPDVWLRTLTFKFLHVGPSCIRVSNKKTDYFLVTLVANVNIRPLHSWRKRFRYSALHCPSSGRRRRNKRKIDECNKQHNTTADTDTRIFPTRHTTLDAFS